MRSRLVLLALLSASAVSACSERSDPVAPSPASLSTAMERCELALSDADAAIEIQRLFAEIASLESDGALNGGQAGALRTRLGSAQESLSAAQYCPARAQLGSLREQLEDFVRDGVLEDEEARPLVEIVNGLLNDVPPELSVDDALSPAAATIPGLDDGAPRPLARFENADGRPVDFVENELYVRTADAAELQGFLDRWNGQVLMTLDFATIGVAGVTPIHLVRLDASGADTEGLAEAWGRSAGLAGENRISSEAARSLLAAALEEAVERGLTVGVNFVMGTGGFSDRTTAEAAGADPTDGLPYTPDSFRWPYMNRGGPQDIGTAEAWRVMEAMGRFENRVLIGVADGGFRPNADFPDDSKIVPSNGLRVPNPDPDHCGGEGPTPSCTWHGTHVVMAAMAEADNEFGAAGPAGPVGDLVMLQSPSPDFFAVMGYLLDAVPSALGSGPRIVNISAGSSVPTEMCLLLVAGVPACETLHAMAEAFRAAGILVVSSAGNQGRDVDQTKRFGFWPFEFVEEAELVIPCELTSVICVGGLSWDATTRHPQSNWGSDFGSPNTVDIFGPFQVWSVGDAEAADEANDHPDSRAGIVQGTSFASPYVAGVAALIWASNPAYDANQVAQVLLSTAHTGSGGSRVGRWVNALGAVRQAVGGKTPPWVRIIDPADGSVYPRGTAAVPLLAEVEDLEGDPVFVTWHSDRDGQFATGIDSRTFGLSLGTHSITAVASNGTLSTTSAPVTVQIFNEAPVVEIVRPLSSTAWCFGQPIRFEAEGSDPNNWPTFGLPESAYAWRSVPEALEGTGSTLEFAFPSTGAGLEFYDVRVTVTDGQGAMGHDRVSIRLRECEDGPLPLPTILQPATDLELEFDGRDEGGLWYKDVDLVGEAFGPDGAPLPDEALTWITDQGRIQDSILGTGAALTVRLYSDICQGTEHRIRLRAEIDGGYVYADELRRIFIGTIC
jgi:serine protease